MSKQLYGTGVALVTPFKEDESIDFDSLKKLVSHCTDKGADYLVVQGTTGESATTTTDEKREILAFVKDNNPGNLPIVYGLGGNNTRELLDKIKQTDLTGVDAILSVSPYYNKPSQQGIVNHFNMIADASPAPVILYNVPGRTSSNLTAQTTLELSAHDNIIGVKEASGNVEQAMEISRLMPDNFMLISGDDMLTVPLYSIGAVGVISVLANAFADIFKTMKDAAFAGDYVGARKAAFRLTDINPHMYSESNPVGIKYVLEQQGVCHHRCRMPLSSPSPALRLSIDKVLERM